MGKVELKIEIDADLLAQARDAGLPIDRLAAQSLRRALAETQPYLGLSDDEKAFRWAQENAEALEAQRARIEAFGVFGEDLRTW